MHFPKTLAVVVALVGAPLAAATIGTPQAFMGQLDVDARLLYGIVPCRDQAPGVLEMRTRGVPEMADFILQVDSRCATRALQFEGRLESWGWRLGDGDIVRGALKPLAGDEPRGSFWLEASTCPPAMICEFPVGHARYSGVLEPAVTIQ